MFGICVEQCITYQADKDFVISLCVLECLFDLKNCFGHKANFPLKHSHYFGLTKKISVIIISFGEKNDQKNNQTSKWNMTLYCGK